MRPATARTVEQFSAAGTARDEIGTGTPRYRRMAGMACAAAGGYGTAAGSDRRGKPWDCLITASRLTGLRRRTSKLCRPHARAASARHPTTHLTWVCMSATARKPLRAIASCWNRFCRVSRCGWNRCMAPSLPMRIPRVATFRPMPAYCLPVLLCDEAGTVVGAVHAGWKGLAAGVIEATVKAMDVAPHKLMAWFGPAIGQEAFEVGAEVRAAFIAHQARAAEAFVAHGGEGKSLADIYLLARQRLEVLGVRKVSGGNYCTYHQKDKFFSYRRDGVTGRMGTFIWLG